MKRFKSLLYSDFFSPYPNVHFLFQDPIQYMMLHLVVMSLLAPVGRESFSDFSCFQRPWQFWGILVKYFKEFPSIEIFMMFFLMIRLRCWVLGRTTTEVECDFYHIEYNVGSINIYCCWCWPWSPGWGSVCQVSVYKITPIFPISILYSL